MVDLSEQENGVWGRERGDRANTELRNTAMLAFLILFVISRMGK